MADTLGGEAGKATCIVEGNDDLYGLGIKLGVYCSLLATLYAKYFLPAALKGTMTANAAFILAIFIAVAKNAGTGELLAIEVFVTLQILFGYVLCGAEAGSTSLWLVSLFLPDISTEDKHLILANVSRTELAMNVINILRTAIASLNAWFWFYGAGQLADRWLPCTFQIFFFRQFDGYGRIMTLFKVAAIAYLGFQALRHVLGIYISLRSLREFTESSRNNGASSDAPRRTWVVALEWATSAGRQEDIFEKIRNRMATRNETSRLGHRLKAKQFMHAYRIALVIRDGSMMIWTILAIELSLLWSGVGDVNSVDSTGQLVPLVVGLAVNLQGTIAGRIKREVTTGHWNYLLRDENTIQFPDIRISGRQSYEPPSVVEANLPSGKKPGEPIQGQRVIAAAAPPTFFPTGFGNELRGPALNEGDWYPSWRKYYPLQGGSYQIFADRMPRRAASLPNLGGTVACFQPWKNRIKRRGKNHAPTMTQEYGSRGTRSSSVSSAIVSDSSDDLDSDTSDDEGMKRWNLKPRGFGETFGHTRRKFAAAEKGSRCTENVRVRFNTARWMHKIRDTGKAFELLCDFSRLRQRGKVQRRWSHGNLAEVSENFGRNGKARITDFPFVDVATTAADHYRHIREPPWNTKRIVHQRIWAVLFTCLALLLSPLILPAWIAMFLATRKKEQNIPSTMFSCFPELFALMWNASSGSAYLIMAPGTNKLQAALIEDVSILMTILPSVVSLLCTGTPLWVFLQFRYAWWEFSEHLSLPGQNRPKMSRSSKLVVMITVGFAPILFIPLVVFLILMAVRFELKRFTKKAPPGAARLWWLLIPFSPVFVIATAIFVIYTVVTNKRRRTARRQKVEPGNQMV